MWRSNPPQHNCMRAWYSARLLATLKSHKRPPSTWRNIHGSGAPAVCGLSAWLVEQLRPLTLNLPSLLCSSEDFVQDTKRLRADHGYCMYRADVEEFFVSGSPDVLVEGTMAWFPDGTRKDCVSDVLRRLLIQQHVGMSEHDDRVWQAVRGSGVVLKHSSYAADLVFAHLGDQWATRQEVMRAFGIVCHRRLRGDVLSFLRNSRGCGDSFFAFVSGLDI